MCVEARGQQLTAAPCRPEAAAQRFQWLPGKRLWNAERRRCVTAAAGRNLSVVELRPCREDGGLQRWECGDGGLLALAGMRLYFNYGNNALRTVMLYVGDREWSRWVVHGSNDDLCTRSCCPICPQGWTYFGGSCYFYSKTAKTWDNARGFCSAHGAQLLEVDGPEEKAHIQSTLSLSSWLGIRDEELEGTWKRANGSIVIRGHGYSLRLCPPPVRPFRGLDGCRGPLRGNKCVCRVRSRCGGVHLGWGDGRWGALPPSRKM